MKKNKLTAIFNSTKDESAMGILTEKRPIASMPFGGRYRVIDFYLSSIAHAKVRSAAIFIGESGRSIYDHIRSGKPWDLDLTHGGIFTYSQMHHKRALYEAASRKGNFYEDHLEFLNRSQAQYVLVTGTQIVANVNILEALAFHEEHNGQITRIYAEVDRDFVLNRPNFRLFDLSTDNKIVNTIEEGKISVETNKANFDMNMSIIDIDTLIQIIEKAEADDRISSVDALVDEYMDEYNVYGYRYDGYLANLETIQDYFKANMDLLELENYKKLYLDKQPVITKGQNGVPTFFSADATIHASQFATGSEVYGNVSHSIIFRRAHIAKNADVRHSIVMQGADIQEGATVEYAILDKSVTVEKGARIIGTPDNPVVVGKNTVVRA